MAGEFLWLKKHKNLHVHFSLGYFARKKFYSLVFVMNFQRDNFDVRFILLKTYSKDQQRLQNPMGYVRQIVVLWLYTESSSMSKTFVCEIMYFSINFVRSILFSNNGITHI